MSWTIDITATKKIQEKDIDAIIDKLPDSLSHPIIGSSKQSWGWSCGVDVWTPEGKSMTLHGADFSRHIAEGFAAYMCDALTKKGYKCRRHAML